MAMLFWRQKYRTTTDRGWIEAIERTEECTDSMVKGLKPLMPGTPTGLFDRHGDQLLEGDLFRLDHSDGLWQVRFCADHGFIGYIRKPGFEIWFVLASSVRCGKILHRQWLKEITKEG